MREIAATIMLESSCMVATSRSSKAPGEEDKHFENAQSTAVMAQRRNQNGADTQAAATGQIDARIALGVMAQHDFAGADGFGGDAGVGLQTNAEVGSGTSGAGAADNFVAGAQGDGGSGGTGQMLGAFGDGADGGLQIQFRGMNFGFFARRIRPGIPMPDGRHWPREAGCAWPATACGNDRPRSTTSGSGTVRSRSRTRLFKFEVGDEMRGLLVQQRSAQHARKAQQGMASARQAIGLAVGADQLALDAKCGGLQRDKINVLKSVPYTVLPNMIAGSSLLSGAVEGK